MNLTFTNESDFDTLALANTIQDILSDEAFECKISQAGNDSFALDLVITLENKKLRVNNNFRSGGCASTRKVWLDENSEQFSCASSFWRYVSANAKEIKE